MGHARIVYNWNIIINLSSYAVTMSLHSVDNYTQSSIYWQLSLWFVILAAFGSSIGPSHRLLWEQQRPSYLREFFQVLQSWFCTRCASNNRVEHILNCFSVILGVPKHSPQIAASLAGMLEYSMKATFEHSKCNASQKYIAAAYILCYILCYIFVWPVSK